MVFKDRKCACLFDLVKSTKVYFQGRILSQFHMLLYAFLGIANRYRAFDSRLFEQQDADVFENLSNFTCFRAF